MKGDSARLIILGCFLSSFLSTFLIMTNVSLGSVISKDLGLDSYFVMLLSQIGCLAVVQFSSLSIAVTNKFGKRNCAIAGLVIIIATSVLTAMSFDLITMVSFRVIGGLGNVLLLSSSLSIITDVSSKETLNINIAYCHSFSSAGAIFGSGMSFLVGSLISWRVSYLIPLPLAIAGILMLKDSENRKESPESRIHYAKHLLFIIAFLFVIEGLFFPGIDFINYVIAAVLGMIVIAWEYKDRNSDDTLFRYDILSSKLLATSLVIGLLFNFASNSINVVATNYLQILDAQRVEALYDLGLMAAVILTLKPLLQVFLSPYFAKRNSQSDNYRTLRFGLLVCILSAIAVIPVLTHSDIQMAVTLIISTILVAVATSAFQPLNRSMIMSQVEPGDRNTASTFVNVIDNIGRICGTVLLANFLAVNEHTMLGLTEDLIAVVMICIAALVVAYLVIGYRKSRIDDSD